MEVWRQTGRHSHTSIPPHQTSTTMPLPTKTGLYDPAFEHDACGVGFVANVKGVKSHSIVEQGLQILVNLAHRGACGCDPETGDGAGLTIQTPDAFLRKRVEGLPAAGQYGVGMT